MIIEKVNDCDILRPLNDNELEDLLKLYEQICGTESIQYLLLYSQCKWNKKMHEMKIDGQNEEWIAFRRVFYTYKNGDFRTYGTYVCLHQDVMQTVSFHSWEPNFNELLECLNRTHLIQWNNGPLLIYVAPEYSDEVKKIALNKGATIQRARQCSGLVLTHSDALHFNETMYSLPDGYRLAQLQETNAELIHSLWPNNKEASLEYVRGLMKIHKSIGIYEEATNALVGWIFQNELSGLGILQVVPSEQRKGFGTILARALSKHIAESECINLSAWVLVGNMKSESLLQKVGFRKTVIYEWIQLNKIN